MIYSTRLTNTGDSLIFTSTNTGAPVGGAVVEQTNAITMIAICNTGTPNLTDETVNTSNITVNLVVKGSVSSETNRIISSLTVPAGETVFLSEERIILAGGDQIRAQASDSNLLSVTVSFLQV